MAGMPTRRTSADPPNSFPSKRMRLTLPCCPMSITMWSIALLATTSFSASFDLMDVSFYEALLLTGSER